MIDDTDNMFYPYLHEVKLKNFQNPPNSSL